MASKHPENRQPGSGFFNPNSESINPNQGFSHSGAAAGTTIPPYPGQGFYGQPLNYNGFYNQHPEQFESYVRAICSNLTNFIRSQKKDSDINEAFIREAEWFLVNNLTSLKLSFNFTRFYFTVIRGKNEFTVELYDIMDKLTIKSFKVSLIRKDQENKEQATN